MTIEEISVAELLWLGESARVIDVREPDEWAAGHIAHASHVPLGTVPDEADQFDGDPTYVICLGGVRSMKACEILAPQGRPVVNVAGGMRDWIDAGYPVVVDDTPGGDVSADG